MLDTILNALLPMVVTFLLGFVAAWRHDFQSKDASILNRMVLLYAVPLALFAGTVTTSRTALSQDIPLVIALCVAVIGLYAVVFLFSRIVFRMQLSASALAALTASAPAVPFVGPAVLGELFGRLSAIPIAVGSLVINLTVVPITILFLAWDLTLKDPHENTPIAQEGEHSASSPGSYVSVFVAIEITHDQQTLSTFYDGFGGGWEWRGWGGDGFGEATTTTEVYQVGTLVCPSVRRQDKEVNLARVVK